MRVLLVIHQFFPEFSGGTERVALHLAQTLQHAGHAVRVLTCRSKGPGADWQTEPAIRQSWNYIYDGVPVTAVARERFPAGAEIGFDVNGPLADELHHWLDLRKFHVAHVMHTMRMATAVMAIQKAQIPYVVTLTDFFLPCYQINLVNVAREPCAGPQAGQQCAKDCRVGTWTRPALLERYTQARSLLEGAAVRVVPSNFVQSRAEAAFDGMRFVVVSHGLNLLALLRVAQVPAPPGDDLILAYAGTLIPQKGLHVLLEALALMPDAKVQLRLIGARHGDGAYHHRIDKLVASDRRVTWLGEMTQQDMFRELSQCDLLCLPSLVPETFSLTFHEAAALGVPALVSDHGAPADIVRASDAGRCVTVGVPQAWAEAICDVLTNRIFLQQWKNRLPMPSRIEEEAFFYESLYRTVALPS